jgi:hypothetical protein
VAPDGSLAGALFPQCHSHPAAQRLPGRLMTRPVQRHGFSSRSNGAGRIATMRRTVSKALKEPLAMELANNYGLRKSTKNIF